jgi:hypothetical protein
MVHSHDQRALARRSPSLPLSSRNLTTTEFEAVIRRAAELQGDNTTRLEEGVPESEVVRIGQELGLEPATIRRAMAEMRGSQAVEDGLLVSLAGPRNVLASRIVNRPAADVADDLEIYLCESEFMLPQRRFADRTRFVRDSSFAAGLARFARGFVRSPRRLVDLKQLDISISAVDADSCVVTLSANLAGTRGGLVGGVIGGSGGATAAWAAVAWATPLPDPLMLLGVPVLAGAWLGTRAIFHTVRRSVQERIESLLDEIEHDTLP